LKIGRLKKIIAFLLSPISMLYGMGVSIHQSLYYSGLFKSVKFSIPIINIGNLSVGGTGKSPHIEYILKMIHDYLEVGVISRGYRRKSSGYILLDPSKTVEDVGDEPIQMARKFPNEHFAVSESRSLGIPKLLSQFPNIQVILMDDGFQHLEVKAGLNILLTEYNNPFFKDFLLPSGRLREWRFGSRRAQIIIVTKCPAEPSEAEEHVWRKNLGIKNNQQLFFSTLEYHTAFNVFDPNEKFHLSPTMHVTLISAVAQSSYLVNYIEDKVATVLDINYEDHHFFSKDEVLSLIEKHKAKNSTNKIILTTEKDATRLALFKHIFEEHNIKLYAIPISVLFYKKEAFEHEIKTYLLDFKV